MIVHRSGMLVRQFDTVKNLFVCYRLANMKDDYTKI